MPTGIYVRSEGQKQKIREANLGKHLLESTKKKLSEINMGDKGPNWKGGIMKHSYGYVLILMPNHPFTTKRGYVFEHRLVMEQFLGRYLTPKEIVHHINDIKSDNRIENLILFKSKAEHTKYHRNQAVREVK